MAPPLPQNPVEKKSRLLQISGDIPRDWVERHFERLDSDYWNEFPIEEIHTHLAALKSLSKATPHFVKVEKLSEGLCGLTLIGGDHPGFFAAVSGFLAASGYDIRLGKVFTFDPDAELPQLPRGGIIDFLLLRKEDKSCDDPAEQSRLKSEMMELFRRFESGDATGIRIDLYRRIGSRLEQRAGPAASGVPLEIRYHLTGNASQISVRGRDREAMLFCIASALSLQGVSIQKLLTTAHDDGFFEDRLTVTGPGRQPLRHIRELEKVRTGISLMERLLETLPRATHLQAAAEGLQALVEDWLDESAALGPGDGGAFEVLPALSRVLTAGPHMWEMVDRLGPRAFRQLLVELTLEARIVSREQHLAILRDRIPAESDPESRFQKVRAHREREVLKAELDLLLTPSRDLNDFSDRLTSLAEALLIFAIETLWNDRVATHGRPCAWSLFALGKFGGEELGSGSDLEILLIYAEPGETSGKEKVSHAEFYEELCRSLLQALETRPGETLALDFRLRPHGDSGPLAVGFAAWRDYFAPNGGALDYEKQALIRLRGIHGDETLVEQILTLRDSIAYSDPPVPIEHTLKLHQQQIDLKTKPGIWNAKFSPGGMAELEYGVQFLQLKHGWDKPLVRRHNLDRALESLLETGFLTLAEFEHLYSTHLFLRRLINALRLVRGQARDLHCPAFHTPEFSFLTRRLGYVDRSGSSAEVRLERDLNEARRIVGAFFRFRFLEGDKPEWLYEGLSETLMDPEASLEEASPALLALGMRNLSRARTLLLDLFDRVIEKRLLAACLLQFRNQFLLSADPEETIQKLNRYLTNLKHPDLFIRQALHNPVLLETLLDIFANSETLSDLMIREGENFKTLAQPESLEKPRMPEEFHSLATRAVADSDSGEGAATSLAQLRNREYLRIALRDLRLQVPLREVTYEISRLSDAIVESAFRHVLASLGFSDLADRMCILALGKLGGLELNYSSDIDLIFVIDDAMGVENRREDCEKAGRALIEFLTRRTSEGRLFRVDMNLRPWGGQGPLAGTLNQYRDYFTREAAGWELQAWIKARAVCGNLQLGSSLVRFAQHIACAPENRKKIDDSMRKVRLLGLDKLHRDQSLAGEVKLGPGGLRTVEFFVQAQQIDNGADIPELITGNTLESLGLLNRYGLLASENFKLLSAAYIFLRRVEHRLQLQALQQRHALPTDSVELERLAKQMGFEDRIGQSAVKGFLEQYRKHMLSLQPISAELFEH